MLEILRAGGWIIVPILICSTVAMAIIIERGWALRKQRVVPPKLVAQLVDLLRRNRLERSHIEALRRHSPLGRMLAAGITQSSSRAAMQQSLEGAGRQVIAELERFLSTLGTIAEISPLLGLLGTTFGMIQTFNVISTYGVGDPNRMAGGIAVALISTAAGLAVAIPALLFHRYFQAKVDDLALALEREALRLLEAVWDDK